MTQNEPNTATGLNAYLDGQLGPEEAAEIEARMEEDTSMAAQFDAYLNQKDLTAAALERIDTGTVNLKTAALERRLARKLAHRSRPRRTLTLPSWPLQAAAAAALVAFGWWGHGTLTTSPVAMPDYVAEAVGAHRVFADEVDYAVEFQGDAVNGALAWFSSKLGSNFELPDLGRGEMRLVGARMHGTKEGPLLQLIYETEDGTRISLNLCKHPEDEPVQTFAIADYQTQKVAYWGNDNLDYALVANMDAARLRELAGVP